MKAEPLKGKLRKYHGGMHPKCNICKIEKELKSAVEWCKKEASKELQLGAMSRNRLCEILDEAFEDVMEDEDGKKSKKEED